MKQKIAAVLLAVLVAMVVLGFVLAVVPVWAQNAVPPTAREAATMPEYARRLHPSVTPQAANKSPAPARNRTRPASPQDNVIYENGPVNGTTDAWTINFGYVVSDSFVPNGQVVTGFDIWVWEFPGDVMTSVDWSITDSPNGGMVYGSGTANVSDQFVSTNQYGYNIDKISVGLNVNASCGTCYLNLQNAVVPSGDPVYWDENSGQGCYSGGCPSQAVESGVGTIPSEAFDLTGSGPYQECVHDVPKDNFKIIHSFTAQEQSPEGVAPDRAGNLYGATAAGGDSGAGLVYELFPKGQGWLFAPLYSFTGGADGVGPMPVILGPNGTLYGTAGGGMQDCNGKDCGLVFNLRPPPTACLTALCGWTENVIYRSKGGTDGWGPGDNLVFDQAGNLYGTTPTGGAYGHGTVYELMPSGGGGWTETVLYSFTGGNDGDQPDALLLGKDGSLYGTTAGPGGAVMFQLVPIGGSWEERVIGPPLGSLIQDSFGNLYGFGNYYQCFDDGGYYYCDTFSNIFMGSRSNFGDWRFAVIDDGWRHHWLPDWGYDVVYDLAVDAAGEIYGTEGGKIDLSGSGYAYSGDVFRLVPGDRQALVSFEGDNFSNLTLDASGNIYGTTAGCGTYKEGTVWQLSP
jgi:uncharacterized repeat protein (TIGR03803 family)